MALTHRGQKRVEITNTSVNPVPITPDEKGDFLNIEGQDIQYGRLDSKYTRNVLLADNTIIDGTERIIGEGIIALGIELTRPATTRTITFASTSANDTTGGSGMISALLVGLDSNFLVQVELITFTGQTPVDTVNQYLRVNEFIIRESGSSNTNEGVVYVSDDTDTFVSGVPQNRVYDIMNIGHGLSKTGLWTIPANKQSVIRRIIINTTADTNNPGIFRFYRSNKFTGFPSELLTETIYTSGSFTTDLEIVRILAPEEDIRITGQKTGAGNISVSVKLHTTLIDN